MQYIIYFNYTSRSIICIINIIIILLQEIREKCEREANEKHFGTIESEKPQNRCLNRYRDVNPYDHSRIIIHRGGVDYINANLVKVKLELKRNNNNNENKLLILYC